MYIRLLLTFFTLSSFLFAQADERKTICLSMIVKNEASIIEECLNSVKDIIDYWVIFDTGSTDGTQKVIQKTMQGIPGELHEATWINFAHNRNQALNISRHKADYSLFIDADERVIQANHSWRDQLVAQTYLIDIVHGNTRCKRKFLVRNDLDWIWEGPIHEYPVCSTIPTRVMLQDVYMLSHTNISARSKDPHKYLNDALAIEKVLKEYPNSARYVGFLAQSYFLAGEYQKAYDAYQKRITMKGWDQEVFMSMVQKAIIEQIWQKDPKIFIKGFCDSYKFRQTRAEPLYYIANHFLQNNEPLLAFLVAQYGMRLPIPQDTVHMSPAVYDYALKLIVGNAACMLGDHKLGEKYLKQVFEEKLAPPTILQALKKDLENLSLHPTDASLLFGKN